MANKNLGSATQVGNILSTDSILAEVGGSVRRIKLGDLRNVINAGNEQLLNTVAWGVNLQPKDVSSTAWGRVGNLEMFEEYKRRCGRYLVTPAGLAVKLMTTDSGKYADGGAVDTTKGNIMTIRPRLYYLVKNNPVNGQTVLWMSQLPIGGDYIEQDVSGAYFGAQKDGVLVSHPKTDVAHLSITAAFEAAQKNGTAWGLCSYQTYQRKLVALALSEYGDSNIQEKLGYGLCGSVVKEIQHAANALLTGATESYGDACAKIDVELKGDGDVVGENCCHVSLFGTENPYGFQWTQLQGVYYGASQNSGQSGDEIFIYEGNRMPTSVELTTVPTGTFRKLKRIDSCWTKECIIGDSFDLFASVGGGDSGSGWGDYSYVNKEVGQLCLWGGSAYSGALAGLVCSGSDCAFPFSASHLGARLAYYGPVRIVGKEQLG